MSDLPAVSVSGEAWTRVEIGAAVAAYVDMLQRELRGERFSKAETVRRLRALLPVRSEGSIERKLQNISAILDEQGLEWIDGYKPLSHYQRELKPAVLAAVSPGRRIAEALASYGTSSLVAATGRRLATDDVLVSPPSMPNAGRRRSGVALTGGPLAALRDFQTRQLGAAGEEWVIQLERERLARAGRSDLADRIAWVSRDLGDGAGYDVASFRPDGRSRMIEVKTTNLGPKTPFYITRWEVEVSARHPDEYSLYRVHGFARDPRIYILDGSVHDTARLEPKVFLGIPI